jgi:hypothetical protein
MIVGGSILVAQIVGLAAAVAGPWEDGMAAYNRGDYVPAIRLFRPLAEGAFQGTRNDGACEASNYRTCEY